MSGPRITAAIGRGVSAFLARLGLRGWIALILAVLVIAALGVARLIDRVPESGDKAKVAVPSASLPHDGDAAAGTAMQPSAMPLSQAAVNTATAFVRELILHPTGETAQGWVSRLTPYITPTLAAELASSDPLGIPASKVTGKARGESLSTTYATVTVPTNNGDIVAECLLVDGVWQVDRFYSAGSKR